MGKPNWFYSVVENSWILKGKRGRKLDIPETNPHVTNFFNFVGTSAGITAVGSAAVAVGTVTNATGLAVGDIVFGNPKVALAGHVGAVGFHVPTNDTLNVYIANIKPDSAGSIPAEGWDIFAIRTK